MISLLRRNPRITAPRKPAARTACKLAVLLALAGGPAVAQHPGRQSVGAPPSPVDTFSVPAAPVRAQPEVAPAVWRQDKKPDQVKEKSSQEKEEVDRKKYVKLPAVDDVFAFPDDPRLERAVLDRLRKDMRDAGSDPDSKYGPDVKFPPGPRVGGGVAYHPKTLTYPPMRIHYEPLYVVHRRLHFEEKNAERYGWDLGIIQPLVSAAYFYKDVLLWPNSLASGVAYGFWDTNVGKCLPGSPTPYMLYPPGLTITGTVVEGVFVTWVAFAIP